MVCRCMTKVSSTGRTCHEGRASGNTPLPTGTAAQTAGVVHLAGRAGREAGTAMEGGRAGAATAAAAMAEAAAEEEPSAVGAAHVAEETEAGAMAGEEMAAQRETVEEHVVQWRGRWAAPQAEARSAEAGTAAAVTVAVGRAVAA